MMTMTTETCSFKTLITMINDIQPNLATANIVEKLSTRRKLMNLVEIFVDTDSRIYSFLSRAYERIYLR